MPEGISAAPAAAAPVSTPSPAPVSTPAPTPAPSSTPAATETPAAATPTAGDTGPGTPVIEAPKPPARSDFPDDADGIRQFLEATNAFEEENPDGIQLATGDEVNVEGEPDAPKVDADEPLEEVEAAEEETPKADEKAPAPTPQELQELLTGDPALAAALEANPAAKGKLFKMARVAATAAPILALVPTEAAAKFAVDNANEFVGLKTAIQLADSPEKMQNATGMFLEQFAIMDDKGAPVLDAKGNQTYGDDLAEFTSAIKTRDNSARIETIKERIEAGQYATAEGKDNDEQLLAAYEFIAAAEAADPAELDKPDTSNMSPEVKAYFEREQAKLAAEKEKLGIKDKEFTSKQKTEARERYRTKYREELGGSAGKYIGNYLATQEAAGVVIPRYMLQMVDPKTQIPVFALQAFNRFNEKISKDPSIKAHNASLEINAINDSGLKARVDYGQTLIDEYLPSIIDDMLKEAGVATMADANKLAATRDAKRTDARVEPAGGGPVIPRGMSDKDAYAKAKQNILAKEPNIDQARLMEKALIEMDRIQSGR